MEQDRFTTCFKTCGTSSIFRRVEWGFKTVKVITLCAVPSAPSNLLPNLWKQLKIQSFIKDVA